MSKILFKYPSRSRPNIFKRNIKSYISMLSGKHRYEFIVSMDNDERTMNNHNIKSFLNSFPDVKYFYDNNKCKVQACNANIEKAFEDWQILVLVSDDMVPQIQGYDDIIYQEFISHFPDFNGALFFPDGRIDNGLNTISIMGRKLYDHFGYIYHPSYISLWCDNEYTDVLKSMNKLPFINKVIIKHKWVGENCPDELHRKNESYYSRDEQNYKTRKANGFPK